MTTVLEVKNMGTCLQNSSAVEEFLNPSNFGIVAVRSTL